MIRIGSRTCTVLILKALTRSFSVRQTNGFESTPKEKKKRISMPEYPHFITDGLSYIVKNGRLDKLKFS